MCNTLGLWFRFSISQYYALCTTVLRPYTMVPTVLPLQLLLAAVNGTVL